MSNLIINCPHCDRPTPVELGKRVTSKQRCKHCGLFVGESEIVVGGRKPLVRKRVNVAGSQFGGEQNLDDAGAAESAATPRRRFRLSHMITMVILVLTGLGAVGVMIYRGYTNKKHAHQAMTQRFTAMRERIKKNDAEDFAPKTPTSTLASVATLEQAAQNLKELMKCETPEALLQYVRNPEKVEPRFTDYYKNGRGQMPISDWLVTKGDMRVDYDESLKIAIFYASTEDGEPWWIVFEETDDGPKLDWESFVRYSEQDVFEFLEQKPRDKPREFRLLAMRDDYFNYKYSDPTEYICVALFDPRESFTFCGYAKKNSPAGRQLLAEVPPKVITMDDISNTQGGYSTGIDGINPVETQVPGLRKPRSLVTIKIKFPDPLQGDNQVEITEFIRRSWYVP